jgi:ParB-like chromosome segregation protein Spo0J
MTTDEFNQLVDNLIRREDDRIERSSMLKEIMEMTLTTTEEIYEQIVKPLPAAERLRLVGKIVYDLSIQATEGTLPERHDWMSLRGVAPDLLDGEDAQTWVSRTRRESDEERERQWRPE